MTPRARREGRDLQEAASALAGLALMRAAEPEVAEALAATSELHRYDAGETILKEGRLPRFFYLLHEGRADVIAVPEGSDAPETVNVLGPGDYFGEIGLIEGMPATATVRANTECSVYRVPAAEFLKVARRSPAMVDAMRAGVLEGLQRTHESYKAAAERRGKRLDDDVLEIARRIDDLPADRRRGVLEAVRRLLDVSGRPPA